MLVRVTLPWSSSLVSLTLVVLACSARSAVAQEVFYHQQGTDQDGFSTGGVVLLADINGDGVRDYLYGNPHRDRHHVRSGADLSLIISVDAPSPTQSHAAHGEWVAPAGDWDGDGVQDYVVGAPGYSPTMWSFEGRVVVYSGATHRQLVEISEHVNSQTFGRRVFGLGDINGDGQPEIAVTSETVDDHIRIYSAPNGDFLRWHNNEGYDYHVETYGDWDGDGCSDYMITNMTSVVGLESGSVWMYSGATGQLLLKFEGLRAREHAGVSFSIAGDWNNDGVEDVAVGAPGSNGAGYSSNKPLAIYIYSGADATLLRTFEGLDYTPEGSNFSFSMDSGHDVNGDGFPDLIAGAPGLGRGAVYVISGRSGALLWRLFGRPPHSMLGRYVRFLPDRDGDGLAEWMVVGADYPVDESWMAIYHGASGDRWSTCGGAGAGASAPTARLFAAGPISLRENELQLSIELGPANAVGFLFAGQPADGLPFGQGQLCLGGSLTRVAVVQCDASGNAFLPLDLHQAPFGTAALDLAPGDTRAFQFLFRDPATSQPDSSDAVAVRFLP